jgi:hypothetical protein
MPMREECKWFESRAYGDGETVRQCALDLAPEAPWRCPADCAKYERRIADINWAHGSLVTPPTPDEPAGVGDGDDVAYVLDEAEDIVNSVGPSVVADFEAEQRSRSASGRLRRLFRRGR